MNIDDVYKQLTSVDIKEQKQLWDERGKGYFGEYLVFCELYKHLDGRFKILMNLNIPVKESMTTEIDLLLIHETGFYVFEMKHYKGTIYGKTDDQKWTQYFSTQPNHTFNNPIKQNEYHINALKQLFPDIPVHSCIVFTNIECDIRVENNNVEIDIFNISEINYVLNKRFSMYKKQYSMEQLDDIFNRLSVYSPMKKNVIIDYQKADFQSWIQPIIDELENVKKEKEKINQELQESIENSKKEYKLKAEKTQKDANIKIALMGVIMLVMIIGSWMFATKKVAENTNELNTFKQNFLHIDQIDNEYINDLKSYVKVLNATLSPLTDDAVSFTARIVKNTESYGIMLTERSKYIVMKNDGMVYEYDVFGEHLAYNMFGNMIGKGIRDYGDLAKIRFYGISDVNDVSYIKITGITLFKLDVNRTTVKDNLEIELYSK